MGRMRSSRVVWVPGLVLAVACLAGMGGACGGGAFTAGPTDGGADGPTVDGPTAEGSADGSDDGADGDGGPGNIIYVSNTQGDDANTGRDRAHPKKTIVAALKAATTGTEVDVCAGTYSESQLILDADVRLKGSYDCTAWTRTKGYGFPTFDGMNTTTITNGDIGVQHATLAVVGPAVTHAALVDGFVIQGATMNTEVTYGVDVQTSSSPVITNDVISGGGGSTSTGPYGSIGVRIGGSSSAELALCAIGGGTGRGAVGSTGLVLASTGIPNVHDDVVSGGTGTANGAMPDIAAVGVGITSSLDSSKPLYTVLVRGSDPMGTTGTTVGVLVAGTGVNAGIVGCEIQGGSGTGTGAVSFGVEVSTTGSVVLDADRIYGGSRMGPSGVTFGVTVSQSASFTLENSEIHAGSVMASAGSYAVGVDLAATTGPQIVFDTIYTGGAAGTAIALNGGITAARITDDLILGSDSSLGNFGIGATSCNGVLVNVDHTGFANLTTLYECGTSPTVQIANDPVSLAAVLGSTVTTTGNVKVDSTCSAPWCVPDPSCPSASVSSCMTSILGTTWSGSTDGVTSLFLAPAPDGGTTVGGWSLQPGGPCQLTKGGASVTGITVDMFGTTRSTSAPTMGAVEYTALTPCMP